MAMTWSSPPIFDEETDEDFFDKLVDDDFLAPTNLTTTTTTSASVNLSNSYAAVPSQSVAVEPLSKLSLSERVGVVEPLSKLSLSESLDVVEVLSKDGVELSVHKSSFSETLLSEDGYDLNVHKSSFSEALPIVGDSSNVHKSSFNEVLPMDSNISKSSEVLPIDSNISKSSFNEVLVKDGVDLDVPKTTFDVMLPKNDIASDVSKFFNPPEKDILVSQESVSLVSPRSTCGLDGKVASDVFVESKNEKSNEIKSSKSTTVKEVQWSSFYEDSGQKNEDWNVNNNGFGSDFFTEYGNKDKDNDKNNLVDVFEGLSGNYGTFKADVKNSVTDNEVAVNSKGEVYDDSQYPGWKYDFSIGQWYQVEGNDGAEVVNTILPCDGNSGVAGSVDGINTFDGISTWSQLPEVRTEYPPHMVFDPQYPGWYYDTNVQEWRELASYAPVVQSTITNYHDQVIQNCQAEHEISGDGKSGNYSLHGYSNNSVQINSWGLQQNTKTDSIATFTNTQQPQNVQNLIAPVSNYGDASLHEMTGHYNTIDNVAVGTQHAHNFHGQNAPLRSFGDQPRMSDPIREMHSHMGDNCASNIDVNGVQSLDPTNRLYEQFEKPKFGENKLISSSHNNYGSGNLLNIPHQPLQNVTQFSFSPNKDRSSAGRPPCALVTFGFGGKLIVVKQTSYSVTSSTIGTQDPSGNSISVFNLMDIVAENNVVNNSRAIVGAGDYFNTLCFQSFPGPLISGSVGSKELLKWIDERLKCNMSLDVMSDNREGELMRLLLSLLKIALKHDGKLRSSFVTNLLLKKSNCPESEVAKLFASSKRNSATLARDNALTPCLRNLPSEAQMRATAVEVQSLLVSGDTKEALRRAREGHLWGTALALSALLGGQEIFVEAVREMAYTQFVEGSPLSTLCLQLAGITSEATSTSSHLEITNLFPHNPQISVRRMLDNWEENLAVITTNRSKDDDHLIVSLGDLLWKERNQTTAAQMCYLIAEAKFESYSNCARLCLIGADHCNFPRTYASPEAIQRTEFYEYTKVLGNSQNIELPIQPYKIIYAHMLAEVGKVSDSMKYCQAIMRSLKGERSAELEACKYLASSLEERIKNHQQGGFSANMTSLKLVGNLIPSLLDRSIHRIIGPLPPAVQGDAHPVSTKVPNSQSTIAMSTLLPSASSEPISELMGDNNRISVPNRSISEPDFGRSPKQDKLDQSKEAAISNRQGKTSNSRSSSRFGFGTQIIQRTFGWVSKNRQAKLGDANKFYYDDKLKRWVEEGVDPPEEAVPPPPPTTAAFQNTMSDYSTEGAFRNESSFANGVSESRSPTPPERSSGIPPIPLSSNNVSARGRMGVRSRYVDTFNKSGTTPSSSFHSPTLPSIKPGVGSSSAKFFVPSAVATVSEIVTETTEENNIQKASTIDGTPLHLSFSPSSSTAALQQFPSVSNTTPTLNTGMEMYANEDESIGPDSRRTASWSGKSNTFVSNPSMTDEIQSFIEPSSFMPGERKPVHMQTNGKSSGDDLQEVEL